MQGRGSVGWRVGGLMQGRCWPVPGFWGGKQLFLHFATCVVDMLFLVRLVRGNIGYCRSGTEICDHIGQILEKRYVRASCINEYEGIIINEGRMSIFAVRRTVCLLLYAGRCFGDLSFISVGLTLSYEQGLHSTDRDRSVIIFPN